MKREWFFTSAGTYSFVLCTLTSLVVVVAAAAVVVVAAAVAVVVIVVNNHFSRDTTTFLFLLALNTTLRLNKNFITLIL
jgi:hypothetical protein